MRIGGLLLAFFCLWFAWICLTGTIDPQRLFAGAVVAALVALLSHELLFSKGLEKKFELKRWGYFLAYVPAYTWGEIKAHAKVIRLILHPRMPIKPGIVQVPTKLRSDLGIVGLANAITMTPGTLSVEVDEETPSLYVHSIYVKSPEPESTREEIAKPFEKFLKRIFG